MSDWSFLGDAILGLIVAENLFRDFPSMSEGEMDSAPLHSG